MYKIKILNFEKQYLLEEMIKVFLMECQYKLLTNDEEITDDTIVFNEENYSDKNLIKQQIYDTLSLLTGKSPEWGILTGIRPVKLTGEMVEEIGEEATSKRLTEYFYIQKEKTELLLEMYREQVKTIGIAPENSAGVYIGIPFCPTRCIYCSFASNQVPDTEIEKYLKALHQEIEYVGLAMKETGRFAESIYIGGGTPTTLTHTQLDQLICAVKKHFDLEKLKEFSIEAGRPDTITEAKLRVMKSHGIDRLSINPQSMKDETMTLIGRNHTAQQVREAFALAKSIGFDNINADVIAGLPEESVEDFADSIEELVKLGADSITIHCLAVKRASKLIDIDKDFHYKQALVVAKMLETSREIMEKYDYLPYYLYRQKHMAGAYENTGYAIKGKECIYNMRIMDEHQAIIALGAGGISKSYYPLENRLERVANVTNYQEYMNRIEEMFDRKEKELFRRKKNDD